MSASAERSLVESFEAHRSALTGLAYRMLGSRAEAEDVVQDAYLRWHTVDPATIEQPRRYLGTVVTRLCLDRMKSAKARHEIYVGQWLPEPLVDEVFDPDTADDLARDLSVALMLVLERLSPLERAAFLLHDVFGLDFAGVAAAVGRGETACRQLAARARGPADRAFRRRRRRDIAWPRPSAKLRSRATRRRWRDCWPRTRCSGGGKRAAAFNPIHGADKILRFIAGVSRKNLALQTMQVRAATVNGLAGFVMREADGSISTMAFECCAGRIAAIYVVRNPEKLRHVGL
jgi:RNA polymerase sigma-70 factor, ECF subfamily